MALEEVGEGWARYGQAVEEDEEGDYKDDCSGLALFVVAL